MVRLHRGKTIWVHIAPEGRQQGRADRDEEHHESWDRLYKVCFWSVREVESLTLVQGKVRWSELGGLGLLEHLPAPLRKGASELV